MSKCEVCDDKATHFPVEGWNGVASNFCCKCFTGEQELCWQCQKEMDNE